ncbi:MAG: BtrH N-terminal domain-containing protein [Lachnospiraceae bacterium]|nr:BtrH N-terminal domain-containing protein [Lachnospiraceae bacterium]
MIERISDFEFTFLPEYDNFCIHNNIKQIMDFYDIANSGFYIDTAIGLKLNMPSLDKIKMIYNIDKSSVLAPYEKNILVNIPADQKNAELSWKEICIKLDEQIPIIALVDVFYLDYMPYYKKEHSIHSIIICDYCEQEGMVDIIDWYKPYLYKGKIHIEELNLARSSKNPIGMLVNSGYPIESKWIEIKLHGWNSDCSELMVKSIDKMEAIYFSPNLKSLGNEYYGINALFKLNDYLHSVFNMNMALKKEICISLHKELFLMPKYRLLLIKYIENFLNCTKISEFQIELERSENVVKKWEQLIRFLVKASIGDMDKYILKATELLNEIIRGEELFYDFLMRIKKRIF